MSISRPAGRPGPPQDNPPGPEKKARSDSGFQSGVQVGFGFTSGKLDDIPVKPKSSVHPGKESIPNTEMGEKAVN